VVDVVPVVLVFCLQGSWAAVGWYPAAYPIRLQYVFFMLSSHVLNSSAWRESRS